MTTDTVKAESKKKIVFRVVARVNVVLFESDNYPDAESFIWRSPANDELRIEKVWVPKA